VKDIDTLLSEALTTTSGTVAAQQKELIEQQKESDVSELRKELQAVRKRYDNKQIAIFEGRTKAIQQRQEEIASESASLRNRLAATAKQVDAVIGKAMAQAVGAPDLKTIQSAVEGKSLENVVLAAAGPMLLDTNSSLNKALTSYSKMTKDVVDFYNRGKKAYDEVERFRSDAERVTQLLKSRSVKDLVQAGTSVYSQLDASTKASIDKVVDSPKLKTVVNLAKQGQALRTQAAQFVTENLDLSSRLKPILVRVARERFDDFSDVYKQVLLTASRHNPTVEVQRVIVAALLKDWSRVVAEELVDAEAVVPVARAAGLNCADIKDCQTRLAGLFEKKALPELPIVRVDDARVKIMVGGKVLFDRGFLPFSEAVLKREIDSSRERVLSEIDERIAQLSKFEDKLAERILRLLPDASFDKEITEILEAVKSSKNFDDKALAQAIVRHGERETQEKTKLQLVSFALGSTLVGSADPTAPSLTPRSAGASTSTSGASQSMEMQVALQALAMSGPYGAAAAMAVQVATAIGEMSDLSDQASRLDAEDKQLTVELVHIEKMVGEARFAEAIADLEEQIAQRQKDSALAQRDVLQTAFQQAAAMAQGKIRDAKMLMPRLYLKAEMTRMYFDTLDRSLALWVGDTDARRGQVERAIRNDPNWARYSLDGDIGLFGWFDRSIEGERKDLKRLSEHWNRVRELASHVCQKYGCDGITAVVGDVGVTDELSLTSLLTPAEEERLRQWQSAAGPSEIAIPFLLTPNSARIATQLQGVRVVDVAVAAGKGAARYALESASLQHSGVGYVRVGGDYKQESLLPVEKNTLLPLFNQDEITRRANDLRQRWTKDKSMALMEGYPLFSLYVLNLRREADTTPERMEDVKIRFFYSYRTKYIRDEKSGSEILASMHYFAQSRSRSGAIVRVDLEEIGVLFASSDVEQAGPDMSKLSPSNRCSLSAESSQ
jgi:hypothetical protein